MKRNNPTRNIRNGLSQRTVKIVQLLKVKAKAIREVLPPPQIATKSNRTVEMRKQTIFEIGTGALNPRKVGRHNTSLLRLLTDLADTDHPLLFYVSKRSPERLFHEKGNTRKYHLLSLPVTEDSQKAMIEYDANETILQVHDKTVKICLTAKSLHLIKDSIVSPLAIRQNQVKVKRRTRPVLLLAAQSRRVSQR